MKIIVYTANIGNYDVPETPAFIKQNPSVEFVYFTTDTTYRSNDWTVRFVDNMPHAHIEPQRTARYFKLQPHKVLPHHDVSIWFDCCLSLQIQDYIDFIQKNLIDQGVDMVAYTHPRRKCLYKEGETCAEQGLDNSIRIKRQMERYRKAKFPINMGLYDTGVMIRKNNQKIQHFNDIWFTELTNGSKRDQLSHMYAIWKTGVTIKPFVEGMSKGKSPYLKKRKHNVKRKKPVTKANIMSVEQRILNKRIAYKMRQRR